MRGGEEEGANRGRKGWEREGVPRRIERGRREELVQVSNTSTHLPY